MRRAAVAVVIAALALGGSAAAGPYVKSASASRAHSGDVVRVRVGAGLRFYALLPLYLVSASRVPPRTTCRMRNGQSATCEPRAARPPRSAPYHRIGTLNVRHRLEHTIAFHVPRLTPGRYVYVLYCGPCYRGPGGSLIAFDTPSLTIAG